MNLLVVTPTRGESQWLPETVASVAAHGGSARHLLVAPRAVVGALADSFPNLRVIEEPAAGGMYAAINEAASVAGEWSAMTYLNDDDVLLPDFSAVVRCSGAEGSGIVYGGVRLIDRDGRRIGAIPISPSPRLNRALYARRIEPVYQHGTVVSRGAWEKLRGFDATLRFCGDSDLLARATLAGIRFARATRAEVAAFRLRAGQLTKDREAMNAERRQVDERLHLLASRITAAHRWACWRFRLANLPIYVERVCRHGFISFDELVSRVV